MASSSRAPAPPVAGVNLDKLMVRWRLLGGIIALANGRGAEDRAEALPEAELEEHAATLLAACTVPEHAVFALQNGCGAACAMALQRTAPLPGDRLKELLLGTIANMWREHPSTKGPLGDDEAVAHAVVATLCSTDHPDALREGARVLAAALKCELWLDAVLQDGTGLARLMALAERSPHPGLVTHCCDALATLVWCQDGELGIDWLVLLRAGVAALLTHAQAPPSTEVDNALVFALDLIKAVAQANEDDPTVEMALAVLARDGSFHMALLPLIDRYVPPVGAVAAVAAASAVTGDRKGKRKALDAPASALGVDMPEDDEDWEVRAPPDMAVSALSHVATRLQRAMMYAPPEEPGQPNALTALLQPLREGAAGTLDTLACMEATCGHDGTMASVVDLLESIFPERRRAPPSRAGSPIRLPGGPAMVTAAALPPVEVSADSVAMLVGMGFDAGAAEGALRRARGDVSRAAEFLLS
jgi:hypothetical protein